MSQVANPWAQELTAAEAPMTERMQFIRRTYLHLAGAIAAFIGLEAILLQTPLGEMLVGLVTGISYGWLIFIGLFMVVSWVADSWASSNASKPLQYAGLGLYVVAEAILLTPLMYFAIGMDPYIPLAAGATTLVMFGALTGYVLLTRSDFSFLRPILMLAGFGAFALIAAAVIFQFSLGPIFSVVMVVFACGYILYHTSAVLHHYNTTQHVAASLALFASVALLFWYILRLYMAMDD